MCRGIRRHANSICNLLGLYVAQTGQRIDELGDDFFWRAVRHFFNVHAAFAGRDKGNLLAGTVGHDRHVIFFIDVCAVFYIETTHLLTFGASLVGFELHAQNLARQAFDVINGFSHFHAATLAATTRVDLGLHHPDRAAQFLCGFHRFLDRKRWNAAGNGHAELTQDFLALVLVNLHEISLGIVGWMGLLSALDRANSDCLMKRQNCIMLVYPKLLAGLRLKSLVLTSFCPFFGF